MKITFALSRAAILGLAVVVVASTGARAAGPKFYSDDPVWVEKDHQDASKIRPWGIDLTVDIAYNLFWRPGDPTPNVRAQNVNTVDEVPDSAWYENRLGRRTLTPEDVAKGPDTATGPAPGKWTVISSKTNGITPGFTIRDSSGQVWFLKFDAPGYRGMATGTEVMVTKLLWALGYHVPENYIAYLKLDEIEVDERARFSGVSGGSRPMRLSDVAGLLRRADREEDGSYRVIASKALPKVGEFRFYDTNPDDPNDLIPHEHRRELRGYGTFSAWLNHVDAKGKNTLDALIKEPGGAFVRHYLQDFGATVGSASIAPREHWEGFEYVVEPGLVGKQIVGFGFVIRDWHTMPFYESRSIGRLPRDNTRFNPDLWKPRVSNAAFVRARADDKFWAATKLAAMTDEMLRAAARTGVFHDQASEDFLVKALGERRDAILRMYLTAANPISEPAIEGDALTFKNVAVDARVAQAPQSYQATWFEFDNATHQSRQIGSATTSNSTRLALPGGLPSAQGSYLRVELAANTGPNPSWMKPVHAYFRRQDGGWRLVGFERMPEGEQPNSAVTTANRR